MPHPPPEMQNPRTVDRHPQAGGKHKRRFIGALNTFDNIKISEICKTNFDGAPPETAMAAALRDALRRKAVAR